MNKIKSLITILAASSVPFLYSCDRAPKTKTITIDVDPNYFKESYTGRDEDNIPYFGYNLNGLDVLLTFEDINKIQEWKINSKEVSSNLDSLEITLKSTYQTTDLSIHTIKRLILSTPDSTAVQDSTLTK